MPAKKIEDLESTRPSEIALETNVLRYLANCLERRYGLAEGAVTLTSPTQHEEKTLGFDAMAGLPDGRYTVLQFKRPEFYGDTVHFKLPLHQFRAMLRCPSSSAFYILPIVRTNKEMWDLRTCLLDSTLAIDARGLLAPFDQQFARAMRGKRWASTGCDLRIRVDLRFGTACAHVLPDLHCLVPSTRAGSLCRDSSRIGFVIQNCAVKSRNGGSWNRDEWERNAKNETRQYDDLAYIWRGRGIEGIIRRKDKVPHDIGPDQLENWANFVWDTTEPMIEPDGLDDGGHAYAIRHSGAPH